MAVSATGLNSGPAVWLHTNVWADGQLITTFDTAGQHFYFNDPLGTRRYQTDAAGIFEQTCQSLPYGDSLNCSLSPSAPTEHHFTGKERDPESGLDFFMARYYASNMGRFMSPDWSAKITPVPYASLDDPQSFNLYEYVDNSPSVSPDPDGHSPTTFLARRKTPEQAEKDIREFNAHPFRSIMQDDIAPVFALGGYVAGAIIAAPAIAAGGIHTLTTATTLCLFHCQTVAAHLAEAGGPGGFDASSASRLTPAEISTGRRLAAQGGLQLMESPHIGAEFVDKLSGKTYDAMGQPAAYIFWNQEKFFASIKSHILKSVDYVAIDLKGASKEQVAAIQGYVGGMAKEAQAKIKYVH